MLKALLIIDMQKGLFISPRYDAEGVIQRINYFSSAFHKAHLPVIYIQHDGSESGEMIKGSTDWELLTELRLDETDIVIDKTVNDAFYQSCLEETLRQLNVSELLITGAATEFCVESTVQSSIVKDFNVTIVSDAHTTADREHLLAKDIITHHNWIWENMIPTKGSVMVIETAEIIKLLS